MILGGHFDIDNLKQEQNKLQELASKDDFWNNVSEANKTYQQLKVIDKTLKNYVDLKEEIILVKELIELEEVDIDVINNLKTKVNDLEVSTLLNGEYDNSNCYLEIHPGAGGTESCDWASMLYRMYERFFIKNGYKYKVINKLDGEEAGIKSITIYVDGDYSYGYLKCERGVHRLVRISPFDSNKRRHTSFASVSVIPEFNDNIEIDIHDEDLKIDVYHSSGAGGQSVNTSNSAVRITHLPTKTVVTCQTERSQLRNKEVAMKLLKNKIYEQKLEEQDSLKKKVMGDVSSINFGSQVRSYVLEPYKLVKDHRSNIEVSDPDRVLDGDIKVLMESVLKLKM